VISSVVLIGGVVLEEPPGPRYDERNLRRYIVRARDGTSVAEGLVQAGVARASGEGREPHRPRT
jgi:hypothetical protein